MRRPPMEDPNPTQHSSRSADTEGCILVGQNAGTSTVAASKLAFDALYPKIEAALQDGGECWITIHNG